MPVDYSKWKNIELSDDEDDTHPNIDTPSLFRWRHQARMERMAEKTKTRQEIQDAKSTSQRKMAEIQNKLAEASLDDKERQELNVELEELQRQEEEYRQKEAELELKEKTEPWNVDTISQEGFSKSRINKIEKKPQERLSDEEREKQMRNFFDKNRDLMDKFGMLKKWDDTKQFLLDNRHIASEHTANYLTIQCLNYELEDKQELMEHVAHQCVIMQYLLELAKQLDYSPEAPQLISSYFSKIKNADKSYMAMFDDELTQFKQRVRGRAQVKREEALAEAEEEERKGRLGPGDLDPVDVFPTLPQGMQKCFEDRNIDGLKEVAATMPQEEFEYHLKRCIDSGLWIPDAKAHEKAQNAAVGGDSSMAEKENELRKRK